MMHENIDLSGEKTANLPSRYDVPSTTEGCHEKFALQLLQNSSASKRDLSEILEKSKQINWLKSSSNNLDKNINKELEGISSDSGVSLNNSTKNEESYHWIKENNLRYKYSSNAKTERNNHTSSTNVSNNYGELLNNSSYSSLTLSETNNDYGNIREFYTPQSSGNDDPLNKQTKDSISDMTRFQCSSIGKRLSPEKSPEDIVYPGILTGPKRVGRSADILARVQKSPNYTYDDRLNKCSEELDDSTNFGRKSMSELNKALCINRRSYTGTYNKSNNFLTDMRWRTKASYLEKKTGADRTEKLPKEASTLHALKSEEKSLPKFKGDESSGHLSGIAKSLIHLAHIKRSNKSMVADFLKTLVGCSSTSAKNDLANDLTPITDNEDNRKILVASGTKDNLGKKQSNESIKWLFPNSNRKREEKLRGNETTISDLNVVNNSEISLKKLIELKKNSKKTSKMSAGKQKPINYTINFMHHNKNKNLELETVSSKDTSKECPLNQNEMNRKGDLQFAYKNDAMNSDKSFQGMDTQSALIYLSETLIESAQRAENLLMQKMKDYNDLVCRFDFCLLQCIY